MLLRPYHQLLAGTQVLSRNVLLPCHSHRLQKTPVLGYCKMRLSPPFYQIHEQSHLPSRDIP